jgi:AraC-like DNA-binding protein
VDQQNSLFDVAHSHRLEYSELPSFVSRQVLAARRFHFDLNTKTRSPIKIVVGGSERLSGDYHYHRTIFPYYSIEFVAEGRGNLKLRGKHHDLTPGTVFGFGPDAAITIRASWAELMLKYHVTFVGRQARSLLNSIGFIPSGVQHVVDVHEIREIFDQMIRYGTSRSRYCESLCNSLVPTLVYKIAEQASGHTVDNLQSLATYQKVRGLIEAECQRLKNVKDVADKCQLTVPYVCRLFKRYGQQSPHQYLLRQKMKHAANLLSDGQAKVQDVAFQLGFIDPFHFSRVFKRVFAVSPTEFQRHLVPVQRKSRS